MTRFLDEELEKVVRIQDYQPDALFDPWAEIQVPKFPLETLPRTVARYVETQSELMGCDPAGLAMSCLVALGAAIDHRTRLRMMRNGTWSASPRLWVVLVGDPSRKKTPTVNEPVRPLEAAQGKAFDAWEREVAEHQAGGSKEEDQPPRPPRYVTADITTEKLAEILGRQARGILAKRDELSGWIADMDKYSGKGRSGGDRAFWLQAYDGGRYTVDRIGRGEKHIANLSVSVLGGIQPARLAEMRDQTSDGLLQRFLPVMLQASRFPKDQPAGPEEAAYGRLIRRLLDLEDVGLAMSDDAIAAMDKVRRHIFDIEQVAGGLAPGFQAFAGKLSGMAGSLALILHLVADPTHGRTTTVTAGTIANVQRIVVDFVLPHAFEFYRNTETLTSGDRLQKVASWIITSGKEKVRSSDLTANVALCRGAGLGQMNDILAPFVAAGWLTPEGNDLIARSWVVEPLVHKQFAQRRRIEEKRKDTLASLMNSPRKSKTEVES